MSKKVKLDGTTRRKSLILSNTSEKRIAAQLYQVWLLDKREVWILIHVEIQSQYEVDFGQRMYI